MKKIWWGIGIVLGGVITYGLIEPYTQRVKRYKVHHPHVPERFTGLKVIFLADIHYGRTIKKASMMRLVERVNQMEPDLILLGGDYVMDKQYIKPCFEMLSHLKSSYGTYGVLGNHDVVEGCVETMQAMAKAGIYSLHNDAVWIGETERIRIGGVGDLRTQHQNLAPTLNGVKRGDFVILLSHNPRYVYQLDKDLPIDLVLAGHTHGGQFAPLKHLRRVTPGVLKRRTGLEFLAGRKRREQMEVIVSNGIGTAKFPLRVATSPEIVEIILENEK
ncbi:MAG: metallophosphoesterase [Cellulosilyticaceae bacterium]